MWTLSDNITRFATILESRARPKNLGLLPNSVRHPRPSSHCVRVLKKIYWENNCAVQWSPTPHILIIRVEETNWNKIPLRVHYCGVFNFQMVYANPHLQIMNTTNNNMLKFLSVFPSLFCRLLPLAAGSRQSDNHNCHNFGFSFRRWRIELNWLKNNENTFLEN